MWILIGIGILIVIPIIAALIGNIIGKLEVKSSDRKLRKRTAMNTNPLSSEELERFNKEQFGALYANNKYGVFLLAMIEAIRAKGNAPKLEEYNYPISDWVSKHSLDPIGSIPKWFSWIESFREDRGVFDITDTAYNVRAKADRKVLEFVNRLESVGEVVNTSDLGKLSESIFIKASMDNLLDGLLNEMSTR